MYYAIVIETERSSEIIVYFVIRLLLELFHHLLSDLPIHLC